MSVRIMNSCTLLYSAKWLRMYNITEVLQPTFRFTRTYSSPIWFVKSTGTYQKAKSSFISLHLN